MKKIILLLCIVFCMLSFQMVFADGYNIQVSDNYYDDKKDALVISGTLPDAIGNVPMTLKVVYGGMIVGVSETVANVKDGSVCFEFPPVYFGSTAKSGEYTISVGSLYSDMTFTDTYDYCGADSMFIAMNQILNVKNGTTTFDEIFINYNDALQIDYSSYNSLSVSKSSFNTLMNSKTYNLPSDFITDADSSKVKDAVKTFRDDVSEAISICKFTEIKSSSELNSWINKYSDDYKLDADDVNTPTIDESLIYNDYFKTVMNDEKFLSRISVMKLPENRESLKKHLYEMALLTNIEIKSSVVIKNIFENFKDLFPITKGANDAAYSKLATNRYLTYKDAADAYDAAVQGNVIYVPSSGSTGSSSSWGGSSSGSAPSISTPVEKKAESFDDLKNVKWAEEAILALYEKKIVNGDGNGKFLPEKNVTRSEFLKMLLLSQGIEVDKNTNSDFNDVSPSSWYAPYVATAKKLGIIQGNAEGLFMPDSNITRQDMIVMLYRAEKHNISGNYVFADQDSIADYAKAAVSYYAEKGIISGMGDNRFEPVMLSTRAQAAQLIYNAVK